MAQETEKLLLDCIRANSESAFREAIGRFRRNEHKTDWAKVSREQYAVFLPIYLEAKRLHEDLGIPPETERIIETAYLVTTQSSEAIKRAAVELADRFSQAGIEILFFKGAALLATVYKDNIGIRPMSDIDVLIREKDCPQAEGILQQMSYREDYARLSKYWRLPVSRDYLVERNTHYVYYRGPIMVELHYNIHTHPKHWLRLNDLTGAVEKPPLGDIQIAVPNAEAALLIACTDFIKDFSYHWSLYTRAPRDMREKILYTSLFFLWEIKRILQHGNQGIDWERFSAWTRKTQNEYEVHTLLLLAQKIVRADIPKHVIRKMRRRFSVALYYGLSQSVSFFDCARLFLDTSSARSPRRKPVPVSRIRPSWK